MRHTVLLLICVLCATPVRAHDGHAHGHLHGPATKQNVLRTAASGLWSASSTWEGGKVPATGAAVLIRGGHHVVYDVQSKDVIRGINIAGTLAFATDKSTLLHVRSAEAEAESQR